jgi:hypothetical protein
MLARRRASPFFLDDQWAFGATTGLPLVRQPSGESLVVGATIPGKIERVRELASKRPLLIRGSVPKEVTPRRRYGPASVGRLATRWHPSS